MTSEDTPNAISSLAPDCGASPQASLDGRTTDLFGVQAAPANGSWWADAEWLACHDGKARRTKPGTPMLVDGMAGRASVWRLAGNSIVPQLAAEVLASILDAEAELTSVTSQDRGAQ